MIIKWNLTDQLRVIIMIRHNIPSDLLFMIENYPKRAS